MKKILAILLTIVTVLSVSLVGVSAEKLPDGNMGMIITAPSTVAPGEVLYITCNCWLLPTESAAEEVCAFASNFTFALDETIFDVTALSIERISENIPAVYGVLIDWDAEYGEICPQFGSEIGVTAGEKVEFIFKIGVKVKDSAIVGTKFKLESAYGTFVASLNGSMNRIDCEVTPYEVGEITIAAAQPEAPTHKAPTALGGQVKTTNPAGLRLGFSIADLDEEYTDLKILVKKADGEWKTVNVTKFYDTARTQFTVCITNIPDSAKDVEFTAKAVVTFADGTSTESTAITKSFNGITNAIDANWN